MSAHLSRLHLFQRHLRSLVWVWVWVWDWIHSHTPPRTRSPSSRHPPFTHYPFPLRSLVCGGQPSPHKPRLVVSHSTCPPLSSSPHAHSIVLGTTVINTHTHTPSEAHTSMRIDIAPHKRPLKKFPHHAPDPSTDRGTTAVDTVLMHQSAVYIASRNQNLCSMFASFSIIRLFAIIESHCMEACAWAFERHGLQVGR
jgi:hypothetical protein